MFLRILLGVLLVLHGVIHGVLAVVPNPNAAQPAVATFFSEWAGQWLRGMLSGSALQIIAIVLAVIAGAGFIAAGLAMFDFLLPHDWWRALVYFHKTDTDFCAASTGRVWAQARSRRSLACATR